LDRAFTDPPASILNGYTAMPFEEFMFNSNPAASLTKSSTWIRTLENDTQPIQFTATITDTLNNVVLDTIANSKELVLFAKDIKEAVSNTPDPSIFDVNADSLYLEIKYYAETGDKNLIDSIYNAGADTAFYSNINLRVNDTVRSYVTIHNYFAYDDGSAEFGAGINQLDGRIAYEFVTNTDQFIYRVDIYFPNISRNQAGSPMELYVLDELKDGQNPFLGMLSSSIQHNGINEFVSYRFAQSIHVIDTFYIAFRNLADDGLWTAIGLDKNNDTGNKIYYSVDGSWQQNTAIEGSLMIRPYFTNGLVSGLEERFDNIRVYPNPTTDRVNIKGNFDRLEVVDITGRPVAYEKNNIGDQFQLIFADRSRGLVFIIIEIDGEKLVKKVLLTP
jgi:type IX secretion system substrate protein